MLAAVARLAYGDRLVLALRYFAELSDTEAAAFVGIAPGTYRVRLARARTRLQAELGESDE